MIRVLHVVGGLNRGGAETWLVQVLRGIDRSRYRFDFLVHCDRPFHYRAEVESLGSKVVVCSDWSNPLLYIGNLIRILREYGPYDCVHVHVHYFSAIPLLTARLMSIPIRIVHGHLNTSVPDARASFARQCYSRAMRSVIWWCSTRGVAVSSSAADSLFPHGWSEDAKWSLLFCGIELEPYRKRPDGELLRREFQISGSAFVVGHVGRFEDQKNHAFLVDVATELVKKMPDAMFLLVGDGPLRLSVAKRVRELGLSANVRIVGVRDDVPLLMMSVMDAFMLPSRYEGLPIALLEAQAAGLPCVISDGIAEESDVVPALIERESLDRSPASWANRLACMRERPRAHRTEPLPREWSIEASIENLTGLYRESAQTVGSMIAVTGSR